MPVPPKVDVMAFSKDGLAFKGGNVGADVNLNLAEILQGKQDTISDGKIVAELMQEYLNGLQHIPVNMFPCEDYCSSTYPTHTYPVVSYW